MYVKVNQSGSVLAVDLFAAVDVESAAVTVDAIARLVVVTLRKVVAEDWPHAEHHGEGVQQRREASLARRAAYDAEVRALLCCWGCCAPCVSPPPPRAARPCRRCGSACPPRAAHATMWP